MSDSLSLSLSLARRPCLHSSEPPWTGGGSIWAKWGRSVGFPVLCLQAYGDTVLKSWFLLVVRAHHKGCDNDTFHAVFPISGYIATPQYCKKAKTQNDRSFLFYPPPVPPLLYCQRKPPSPLFNSGSSSLPPFPCPQNSEGDFAHGHTATNKEATQWHTVAVTPVALHSVAHTVSQQIPAILEMSGGCRATLLQTSQKRPCRTYLATPLTVSQGISCKNGSRYTGV